jgi:DNA polymerase-1
MERNGVGFDQEACQRATISHEQRVRELTIKLDRWAGVPLNWGSPAQLFEFFYCYRAWKTPPVERPTGKQAVAYLADHVEDANDREHLRALLEYKQVAKELKAFFATLPGHVSSTGRIHCQLAANTETGRLTCKNPNMQQQPEGVRHLFIASPGHLMVCLDYSGLEWRILAHSLAHRYQDTSLVDDILAGIDPHSATAKRMSEYGVFPELSGIPIPEIKQRFPKQRAWAKTINYGVNYGQSGYGLGNLLRDDNGDPMGKQFGQRVLDAFFKANPGIKRFQRDIVRMAERNGYVRSMLGRYRFLDFGQPGAYRQALNVIQNCAADVMTLAMLRTNPASHPVLGDMGCKVLLNIHDELLFEVPEKFAEEAKQLIGYEVTHVFEGVRDFLCPLAVEGGIGNNWKEAGGK